MQRAVRGKQKTQRAGMEQVQVLELYEVRYSDLMLLSSSSTSNHSDSLSSPEEELARLQTIRTSIIETLGPKGPGLLSIVGVPNALLLRHNLLPLARKLALLDHDCRKRLLKVVHFYINFNSLSWFSGTGLWNQITACLMLLNFSYYFCCFKCVCFPKKNGLCF